MFHGYDHARRSAETHQQWLQEATDHRRLRESRAANPQVGVAHQLFARLGTAISRLRGLRPGVKPIASSQVD